MHLAGGSAFVMTVNARCAHRAQSDAQQVWQYNELPNFTITLQLQHVCAHTTIVTVSSNLETGVGLDHTRHPALSEVDPRIASSSYRFRRRNVDVSSRISE